LKPVDDVNAKFFALGDILKNNEAWMFSSLLHQKGNLPSNFD
jgi:hypothetical protein